MPHGAESRPLAFALLNPAAMSLFPESCGSTMIFDITQDEARSFLNGFIGRL